MEEEEEEEEEEAAAAAAAADSIVAIPDRKDKAEGAPRDPWVVEEEEGVGPDITTTAHLKAACTVTVVAAAAVVAAEGGSSLRQCTCRLNYCTVTTDSSYSSSCQLVS
jgi:hypothetical protein